MRSNFSKPRGTRDILPEEMEGRRKVEEAIRRVFEGYGYREVQTPTFEHLELITTKSGEEIRRHLYHFKDKSGREIALRPELTAPVMRLYMEELSHTTKPVKLYYFGNCFRYERPQSGRYREFWQAGIELIGSPYPEAEAEVIALAVYALKGIGLKFDLQIGEVGVLREILGCSGASDEDQAKVMNAIDKGEDIDILLTEIGIPADDRKLVYTISGLVGGKKTLEKAKKLLENNEGVMARLERLSRVLELLEELGVTYQLNLGIARGLDYYSGVVFEVYAQGLGAQKQICGGGTYTLTDVLGGEPTPTCGFAFGLDRVLLALEAQTGMAPVKKTRVLVVPTSEDLLEDAVKICSIIREYASCELELMRRKLSRALSYANNEGFSFVIIVGDEELERGYVVLRDMEKETQREVNIKELHRIKF
ncbi:MAG: histidine--tRNA ligase [Candidatus Hydrothermarchaeales archaeon]